MFSGTHLQSVASVVLRSSEFSGRQKTFHKPGGGRKLNITTLFPLGVTNLKFIFRAAYLLTEARQVVTSYIILVPDFLHRFVVVIIIITIIQLAINMAIFFLS